MNFLYWFLKITFLLVVLYVGDTYLKNLGWWSVIISIITFILGTRLIDKKFDHYNKQYFLNRLPILADLEVGQIITLELFDGKELVNRVYTGSRSTEILIGAEPVLANGSEKLLQGMKKTRWVKLNKVKEIRIVT